MTFEMAYEHFINKHHETIGKLRDGHGYGEKLFLQKVWWPAFRNLDCLHPEYAIMDMRYGAYFLDYAFLPDPAVMQLAIEIDGYGPHSQQLDRRQFSDQLNRQNFLIATDWKVLRFSVDEIKENASRCIQYLQLLFGRYYSVEQPLYKITILEREAIRFGLRYGKQFSGRDVAEHLQLHRNTAQALLRQLAKKQLIISCKNGHVRVHTWRVNENKLDHIL